MNMFPDYRDFLTLFLQQGYEMLPLVCDGLRAHGVIYMRHDIDFDVQLAVRMAKIEAELDVCATYFFMMTSDSYNLLSPSNAAAVEEIRALGHRVSLHFDPTRYDDYQTGLAQEVGIFESIFKTDIDLVSLHRPNDFFLTHDQNIGGISHTYQSKYLKRLKYVSDSRGEFRYGAPQNTEEFTARASMHLLTHPIWWIIASSDPQSSLDIFTRLRVREFQEHIEANCVAYSRANSKISMGL